MHSYFQKISQISFSLRNQRQPLFLKLPCKHLQCKSINWIFLKLNIFYPGPDGVFRQTPLHLAVVAGHVASIEAVLRSSSSSSSSGFRSTETQISDPKTKPNLNLKNSEGQTVFGLALANEMEDVATELLKGNFFQIKIFI